MILVYFSLSFLFMFVDRFLINTSLRVDMSRYGNYIRLLYFILNILKYFLISFLSIALVRKKFSIHGQYYNIFKVVMLFFLFNVLYSALYNFLSTKISPALFYSGFIQIGSAVPMLLAYYIIACILYPYTRQPYYVDFPAAGESGIMSIYEIYI